MAQSQESGNRTVTVELQDGTTQRIGDGQRLAWNGDGAISMTVRIGANSMYFSKETSPAGIDLSTDASVDTPTWPIGGGGRRPPARTKLAALLRNDWQLVDNDVGL